VNNEDFQKNSALIQIQGTSAVALGTVIISLGITMMTLFSGILSNENNIGINLLATGIALAGLLIICLGIVRSQWRIKKLKLNKPDDMTHGILDEDRKYQSEDSEEKQLQESLENMRLQLQIEELKLEITKLKNQVETEKLNQMKKF